MSGIFFLYILCILSPDIVNICATLFAVLWNRFLHFSSSPCIVVTMWKKHGGQISFLPSTLSVPSPLLALPQYLSLKIQFFQFFPTYFFPVWVTFQMETICFASNFSLIQIQQLISVYVYNRITVFQWSILEGIHIIDIRCDSWSPFLCWNVWHD